MVYVLVFCVLVGNVLEFTEGGSAFGISPLEGGERKGSWGTSGQRRLMHN